MNKLKNLAKNGKINDDASIKDQHSIIVNAPINKVWDVLTDVAHWPEWHQSIKAVEIDGTIGQDAKFKWHLSGYMVKSEVLQFEPPYSLSWAQKTKWIKGVHTWQLEKADDNDQTIVNTSQSLQGVMVLLFINHQKLYAEMLSWLEDLKKVAEE